MKAIGVLVTAFLIWFGMACIAAFCVMMAMGYVHDWWIVIPTMGFWQAFSITVWLAVPLGIYSGTSRSSD